MPYDSAATVDNAMASLQPTPYLVESDPDSRERLAKVLERSTAVREQALRVRERLAREAGEILEPFTFAIQTDLVAESNRIEGYEWTASDVRETVVLYRELLDLPVHHMLESLRHDERVMEALGLFRAHQLADEWAMAAERPRAHDIRALHNLILGGHSSGGRYKVAENEIAGSAHTPVHPGDTPEHMQWLAQWWHQGAGDPVLEAAVVHAWLTHIHPFDDGNGRLARLLANLTLTQSGYPPLLIRSDADRGQYLDALAASDDGDIMPMYEIFAAILRRTVRVMGQPGYIRGVIENRLLSSQSKRYNLWRSLAEEFERRITELTLTFGLQTVPQGISSVESFALLEGRNPDGNSWYLKINDSQSRPLWLMWFGYTSDATRQLLAAHNEEGGLYPSIFFSVRSVDPRSVHPYTPRWSSGDSPVPTEIVLRPGYAKPALLRWDWDTEELSVLDAADVVLRAFNPSRDSAN